MSNQTRKYSRTLLFVTASILWYLQARDYGFVSDFLGWIYKYQKGSYADVLNCFGYNGLHQVFHFINYSVYRLFGINELPWSILFSAWHGINAYLLFELLRDIKIRWHLELPKLELFVSVLFLIAPFQIEVLTWNACLHYIISLFFLLISLRLLFSYLTLAERKELILIHLVFLLSLFTLEINLSIPFILLAVMLFDHLKKEKLSLLVNPVKSIFLPQVIIIVLYFSMNKVILGDWVGHYGTDVHLSMPLSQIIGHAWGYVLHHIFYLDLFDYNTQRVIYKVIFNPILSYGLLLISLIALIFAIRKFKDLDSKLQLSGAFLVMFFMALVPILSLYFYYVTPFKNDRYLYFASPFLFVSFCTLCYYLRYSWRYTLLIVYLIANMIFSRANIKSTSLAAEGADFMLQNFPCERYNGQELVLLGLADNFRGCYLYSEYADDANSFQKALAIKYPDRSCELEILNPAQFNMKFASDGLGAHYVDNKTIKVFIQQWGTWFWRHGKGLASYETERYKVETHGWYYLLHLKEGFENSVFLYPEGAEWKILEK